MEKYPRNTSKKENIMVSKGAGKCLCLICSTIHSQDDKDAIFKSLKQKAFITEPGTDHHFDDHMTTGIHDLCVPNISS
jgi:hypothetical protein